MNSPSLVHGFHPRGCSTYKIALDPAQRIILHVTYLLFMSRVNCVQNLTKARDAVSRSCRLICHAFNGLF